MKAIIRAVLLLALATVAHAATKYVAQSAAGSNDGSSAANAYSMAQLNAASPYSPTAGDTVVLNGTITTALVIPTSGSVGSPVTYQFAAAAKFSKAAWGTGTSAAIYGSGKQYITIDGASVGIIECTDNGIGLGTDQAAYGLNMDNCDNLTVKNLTVRNVYIHVSGQTNTLGAYTSRCLFAQNCDNLLVQGCTLNNAYTGIHDISNGASVSTQEFSTNTISACSTAIYGPALGSSGDSITTASIHNNSVSMGANWQDPLDANHVDGIHAFGVSGTTNPINGLSIYDNIINGDCGTQSSGFIFLEYGVYGPLIYNNLLTSTTNKPSLGYIAVKIFTAQGAISASIYNNTIVGLGTVPAGGIGIYYTNTSGSTLNLKNNILSTCYVGVSVNGVAIAGTWNNDYNCYYNLGYCGYDTALRQTLATWRTQTGGESNSVTGNPSLDAGFAPQVGSSVIGTGVDLSATFTTDLTGATRTVPWDIGAYKYLGVSGSSASGNLSLTGNAALK